MKEQKKTSAGKDPLRQRSLWVTCLLWSTPSILAVQEL